MVTLYLERVDELLAHSLAHQVHNEHNVVLPDALLINEILHLE